LPGLKVLIYNQTDVPPHYLEGVNIPAGFTMDIPFWMRHVSKYLFLIKTFLRDKNCPEETVLLPKFLIMKRKMRMEVKIKTAKGTV